VRKISDGRIIIDTQIDSKGAEKGVKGLGSKLGGIAKTGITAFTGLITASGVALGGLGAIGIKYNSEMEQYMSSFTTMLGSAEKATKHLDDLKQFAAKTPFELGDLAKASTTLQAFGTDVEDITPTLKMLGDIALGDKEKFNGLALVFGQVSSAGKLTGQDLMQMINQGFNPLQIISEKTGKSMSELKDEMSKGQISFEMVADAMKIATSEGGKFYNAMEGQSKTLAGQWSTLKDNIGALLGDMFTSVSDTLKNKVLPAINNVVEKLQESFTNGNLKDSINRIAEGFGNLATKLGEIIAAGLPKLIEGFAWILDNGPGIAIVIGTIASSVVAFKAAAVITSVVQSWQKAKVALALYKMTADGATISQGVMNGVFTVWETIVALMTGEITFAAAATGLWTKATAALNAMWAANPIGIVIVAIVALVGAFIYLWNTSEGFRNFFINAWNMIKDGFIAGWNGMMAFFTETIPSWIESIKEWFGSLGEWFGTLWTNIKQWFVDGWNAIVTFFTESIPAWWEGVKQAFADGWNAVVSFFTVTIPLWLEQMFNWFMELPNKIAYALGFVIQTMINWGSDMWNYLVTNVPIWIDSIVTWFSELPDKIWTWLLNVIAKVVEWGTQTYWKMVEYVANAVNAVIDWFSKLPERIWTWLSNAISKAVQWGQETYWKMVEAVSNAVNAVIEWFMKLPGRIWEWLVNTVKKVIDWGKTLGSEATKAGGYMVECIIDAVKDLPSKFLELGVNIVKGIWEGIKSVGSWLHDRVTGFFDNMLKGAQDANKIKSPSRLYRDEVGKYMAQGVGVGFEDEASRVEKDIRKNLSDIVSNINIGEVSAKLTAAVYGEQARMSAAINSRANNATTNNVITNDNGVTQHVTIVNPERTPSENARALKKVGRDLGFGY